MTTKKKLVLTFYDGNGRKRKINIQHFLEGMAPAVLSAHLMEITPHYSKTHKATGRLSHCIHAAYVETTRSVLFHSTH